MKGLIARLNHETNTFSPVPTPLSAFGENGPQYDGDAYRANHGQRTAMAAFIDLAEARGAELVTPVSGWAYPSGPVAARSEEHPSELQSLMRISYAVFCLKKKKTKQK